MQATLEVTRFDRPKITAVELAAVRQNVNKATRLKHNQQLVMISKLVEENNRLYAQVDDLRGARMFLPLRDDLDYTDRLGRIEQHVHAHEIAKAMQEAIIENIKCTKEINIHRRALGQPEIATFKA